LKTHHQMVTNRRFETKNQVLLILSTRHSCSHRLLIFSRFRGQLTTYVCHTPHSTQHTARRSHAGVSVREIRDAGTAPLERRAKTAVELTVSIPSAQCRVAERQIHRAAELSTVHRHTSGQTMSQSESSASPSVAPANPTDLHETCPRCHTTTSWDGNSWCPNCGYYPSVDADAVEDDSWRKFTPPESVEAVEENIFRLLPAWFWIMIAGVTAILILGLATRIQYPKENSPRGMVALAVLAVGFLSVLVAHAVASRYAIRKDPRIRLSDAIFSWFTIWQPTIGQLPHSRRRIWGFTWGLAASVTAVLIIGGIDYCAPFRTDNQAKSKPLGASDIRSGAGVDHRTLWAAE